MVYDSATWANRANAFMPPDISLAAIAGLRDDLGVLTVYAEVGPAREASQRATWVVSTRSALHALVERAKGDGDRKRRYALEGCLERIEPQLGDLLDARLSGRGRALFAGVGSRDDAEVISLQVPLPTTVRLAERAYLRPLVEALDRGRAAGLVAVSKAAIRVVEQRLGAPQELLRYDLGVETDTWRELRGRAAPSAVRGQQSVAQRERFERRVEEHQVRELHGVVHEIAAMAEERGWDRVAVSGQPQLRAPVVEAVSQPDREIVTSDRDVAGLALRDVALALASDLEAATDARERMLVERALDGAHSGGHGAAGAKDVLEALRAGRVQRLLLDSRAELQGAVDESGAILAQGPSDLVEVMIERAVETDAAISLVAGESARRLADEGGVAATLRW